MDSGRKVIQLPTIYAGSESDYGNVERTNRPRTSTKAIKQGRRIETDLTQGRGRLHRDGTRIRSKIEAVEELPNGGADAEEMPLLERDPDYDIECAEYLRKHQAKILCFWGCVALVCYLIVNGLPLLALWMWNY